MTQPCPICGGRGEHVPPCCEVAHRALACSGLDLATEPSRYAFMRVTMEGDKLVFTQISVAEFHAITPTGDQS